MVDKVKPWVTGLRRELRVTFPVNKVSCLVSETRRKLQVPRGKKRGPIPGGTHGL